MQGCGRWQMFPSVALAVDSVDETLLPIVGNRDLQASPFLGFTALKNPCISLAEYDRSLTVAALTMQTLIIPR